MLTHEQQIDLDLKMYGCSFERLLPDGTIERIDPTTVRMKQIEKDKIYPQYMFDYDEINGYPQK